MFAVIRIIGKVGTRREIENTFKMLRLNNPNNCVLVPETQDYKGMMGKIKDFATYGEVNKDTLVEALKNRLRLSNEKRVDEKILKEVTSFDSFDSFADALIQTKVKLKDFEKLNPVLRLTPPSKGFKSIREHYPKGDLGYRGREINELIKRMI